MKYDLNINKIVTGGTEGFVKFHQFDVHKNLNEIRRFVFNSN